MLILPSLRQKSQTYPCRSDFFSALYVKGFTWQVTQVEVLATKAPVTLFNGVVAVICAALLYTALTPALRKAHVLPA